MISLPDLHDATLKWVNFGWEGGVVHLTFKIGIAASDLAIVEAEGVTCLKCPRLCPWGPSSSVNAAALEELADGSLLTVEMQSGDVLEVHCREVAVKRMPNSQQLTGKERDSETGLDYFGTRYFSSSEGRFTSPDPGPFVYNLVEVRSYDTYRQQPIGATLGAYAGDSSRLGLVFNYCASGAYCTNNNGNLQSQTIGPLGVTQTYTYDSYNRLTQATEKTGTTTNWLEAFNYDNYGNRWVAQNPAPVGISLSAWTVQADFYNSANQLTSGNFRYDSSGNQTYISPYTVSYDAENRQTGFTSTSNGSAAYIYDGDGRRVAKTAFNVTTTYVYDARGELAAEYPTQPPSMPCQTCYLTTDHLGSTRVITDQNGTAVSRHDFLPFGEELATSNRTAALNYGVADNVMHRYTGQQRDLEGPGLDYFGARYFSAAQGRFTSPDPITVTPARVADPQQLNLYAYGRNNPLKYVDPTGMIISTDDLSDKDKALWQKVVDLANKQDDNGNYVNPALHSAYAALDSDSRVFKIEDNPGLGAGTAGLFTITKFNGENDFSEARIDLNFKTIKGINSTTTGDFDPSFQKYSGLLGGSGFIPRLAETFGHEANHGIFAQQDPAQGTAIQKLLLNRDAAMQALPAKGRYPLPPDVLQKMQAADKALVPTERFAQQAEKIINGELKASQVK